MVVQAVLVFTMVILLMFIMLLLKNKRVIQHYLGRSSSKRENFSTLGGRVVPKWKPVGMNNKCSNFPLRMTKISHVSLENFQFH